MYCLYTEDSWGKHECCIMKIKNTHVCKSAAKKMTTVVCFFPAWCEEPKNLDTTSPPCSVVVERGEDGETPDLFLKESHGSGQWNRRGESRQQRPELRVRLHSDSWRTTYRTIFSCAAFISISLWPLTSNQSNCIHWNSSCSPKRLHSRLIPRVNMETRCAGSVQSWQPREVFIVC